jgi:nucleoside-diphosphate-sugar epimerase
MKVLITGAGGFIGSHLVDSQLEKGHDVRAVDLHSERLHHHRNHARLEIITGDITDPQLVQRLVAGIEVIYHLASAHLDVSLSDEHYRRVNVSGTLGLVEAASNAGVRCFVHCSSVGVTGNVDKPPVDETYSSPPTNIYERTKLEGERAALEYAAGSGFSLVVARPAWVYGPRDPRTQKLFRTISKGRFLIFGTGQNWRHPVYISDAVLGLELCAQAEDACGEVYIIAGSQPAQVVELVRLISNEWGVSPPRIHLPLALGKLGGMGLEAVFKLLGKQPPFSRRSLDFFQKNNAYDIGKARRELGYQPQVDLPTGIRYMVRWMKNGMDG